MNEVMAAAERDAYIRRRQAQLDEFSARIEKLTAKLESHETDAWIKALTNITGLKWRQEVLGRRIEEARGCAEVDWEKLRNAIDHYCRELEQAVRDAHFYAENTTEKASSSATRRRHVGTRG